MSIMTNIKLVVSVMTKKSKIVVKLDNMFHMWQCWHPCGVVYFD